MRLLTIGVAVCLIFGLLYRLQPLVLGPDSLAQLFITEDGYLMLTVSRNLALGHGMSVADATIPTNGVQPLTTLLFAVPYLVTGGAKTASLVGIILILTITSVFALWAIAGYARKVLAPLGHETIWPWAMAAVWFVGPLSLLHSMNALETGFHVGTVALTVAVFGQICARGGVYTRRDQLLLGLLCGIAFLVRIDAALLAIAIFATRFIWVQASGQLRFTQAVAEAFPPGILILLIASPWLLYNKLGFGSFMPISGSSQSLGISLGQNLPLVPAKLFETMFPMFPVPTALETNAAFMWGQLAILVLVVGFFLFRVTVTKHPLRVAVWAYLLFAVLIVSYYGIWFGAPHFLSRYFAPLAPLLMGAAFWVLLDLFGSARLKGPLALPATLGSLFLCLALLIRLLLPGVKDQGHFQVVDWVKANVPEETWVAAVQTGTLGYWHDRTINLDGKVNPDALAALRSRGNVFAYVADTDIQIIADWAGITGWVDVEDQTLAEHFEVVVFRPEENLGVLRRIGSEIGD